VLAPAGPAGAVVGETVAAANDTDHGSALESNRPVEADPSNVHRIVHVAPSMSRPLR
jgi:hypothetical protein